MLCTILKQQWMLFTLLLRISRMNERIYNVSHCNKYVSQVQYPLTFIHPHQLPDAQSAAKAVPRPLLCVPYNLISIVHWLDTI